MLTKPYDRKPVSKLWGWEEWIVNTPDYCGKQICIHPGFQSSLHYHLIKDETFYVIKGSVILELGDEILRLNIGDAVRIKPEVPHRFRVHGNVGSAIFIEFSTHHDDNDVVRLEPSRRIDEVQPSNVE